MSKLHKKTDQQIDINLKSHQGGEGVKKSLKEPYGFLTPFLTLILFLVFIDFDLNFSVY